MQPSTWLVVAERGAARIFTVESADGPLVEVERYEDPTATQRDREIDSDRPGRAFDSSGQHRHAMEREVSASERAAMRFAGEIVDKLETALRERRFENLVIVAGPRFLGHLRQTMSSSLERSIRAEVGKNLGSVEATDLLDHLPEGI